MQLHKALVLLAGVAILVVGTAADDAPVRVGIVDVEQAMASTEEGKAAREELARKQREAEGELKPLVDRYRELEEDLEAKKFVLSEDALYQKQMDLMDVANQIRSRREELEGKLKVDQQRIAGPLTKKLIDIIKEEGKARGFTLILSRDAPGVLYTREALDITDAIIEKYDQKG